MFILRGLIIALSGFIFIFAPGVTIALLSRKGRPFPRDLLYWGIGIWLVTLFPAVFVKNLLLQAGPGGLGSALSVAPSTFLLTLIGALVAAFFLQGAMFLVLRLKKLPAVDLLPGGLSLGLGAGLLPQVFNGLNLVGAGFRLTWGDTAGPVLSGLAEAPMIALVAGLLAMILFRTAVPAVGAAMGALVARAAGGARRFLAMSIAIDALFQWGILAIQLPLAGDRPPEILAGQATTTTAALTAAYYLLAFGLAYTWLRRIWLRQPTPA